MFKSQTPLIANPTPFTRELSSLSLGFESLEPSMLLNVANRLARFTDGVGLSPAEALASSILVQLFTTKAVLILGPCGTDYDTEVQRISDLEDLVAELSLGLEHSLEMFFHYVSTSKLWPYNWRPCNPYSS